MTIYSGFSHQQWWFSTAMFNYPQVVISPCASVNRSWKPEASWNLFCIHNAMATFEGLELSWMKVWTCAGPRTTFYFTCRPIREYLELWALLRCWKYQICPHAKNWCDLIWGTSTPQPQPSSQRSLIDFEEFLGCTSVINVDPESSSP